MIPKYFSEVPPYWDLQTRAAELLERLQWLEPQESTRLTALFEQHLESIEAATRDAGQ
jgi:hypothetical protein